MAEIIIWAGENAAAVTALSGLLTALATGAIAWLSAGTFALFRLEKDREAGQRGSLAAHIVRLSNHFRTGGQMLKEVLRTDRTITGATAKAVRFIAEENARRRMQIEALFDRAGVAKMEVTAALDAALILTIGIDGLVEEFEKLPSGSPEGPKIAWQIAVEMEDIGATFTKAYQALPKSARRWAGGKKDYDQLVQEFVSETRTRLGRGSSGRAANGS